MYTPWEKFVGEFLNKRFVPKREGISDRSQLVDEFFGQMFRSYAQTCVSYTLFAAAARGQDKITSEDLSNNINRLFPLDKFEPKSEATPPDFIANTRNNNRNLSKDRKKS